MLEFVLNEEYKITDIDKYCKQNELMMSTADTDLDTNHEIIGQSFLVISNPNSQSSKCISFVLVGVMANQFLYKCIYKD